jgi:hypothetical protein
VLSDLTWQNVGMRFEVSTLSGAPIFHRPQRTMASTIVKAKKQKRGVLYKTGELVVGEVNCRHGPDIRPRKRLECKPGGKVDLSRTRVRTGLVLCEW